MLETINVQSKKVALPTETGMSPVFSRWQTAAPDNLSARMKNNTTFFDSKRTYVGNRYRGSSKKPTCDSAHEASKA